ncbi:sirohydrochlorin chelatase [Streptomyces sp. NPDC051555]|uniref:sirohydrochlorin chelatase n=1 Tax=Streptomyces sp. NPDC051555 TaxID=3365657 RepID=UPI0037A95DD9
MSAAAAERTGPTERTRPAPAGSPPAAVVLGAGHEGGASLGAVPAGRPLAEAVTAALAASSGPVCVVPMTLGRDPKLIADCARALRWLARTEEPGRLVLAPPFATADHLTAWLRTAAQRAVRSAPQTSAVLVTAPAAGPFEDADLFRVARLVRQYGAHRWVEVAFDGGDPDLTEGVDRCRRLGARHVALVRAAFTLPPGDATEVTGGPPAARDADVVDTGPLLGAAAIEEVLRSRVAHALHGLAHGDDGTGAGLDAEHGHGYAHAHGPDGGHDHAHGHAHHHH